MVPTPPAVSAANTRPRGLHLALWVVQVLLALAFIGAGMLKLTADLGELGAKMAWVTHASPALVRFIGLAEVAGALGLILPAATRILPWLTPVAAAALVVVMILAAGTHLRLGEPEQLPASIVLGLLSAFVAWGRFKKAPIAPRA